jgi:ribosomal protein L22
MRGERTKLFDVCDFFRNATVAQAKEFILQRVARKAQCHYGFKLDTPDVMNITHFIKALRLR